MTTETKTKHTPGPWQLVRADNVRCRVVIETVERGKDIPGQGYDLAVAYYGTPIELANARLIAASPTLLAACYDASEIIKKSWGGDEMSEPDCQAWHVLQRAIADATQ